MQITCDKAKIRSFMSSYIACYKQVNVYMEKYILNGVS